MGRGSSDAWMARGSQRPNSPAMARQRSLASARRSPCRRMATFLAIYRWSYRGYRRGRGVEVFTRSWKSGWTQPGNKLVGGGRAVALSGDGNTALTIGPAGAWIFTRSGDTWIRQAKLAGSGSAAALASDGNTAVIARSAEDGSAGAAWVFTRSGDLWMQEGDKLSAPPGNAAGTQFGFSVALSADGNRLLAGAPNSEGGAGAAWEFPRVNGAWTPVGKLTGSNAFGNAQQGYAVALSADGHDAIVGGVLDGAAAGAVWTFADPTLSIAVPAAAAAGTPVTITVMAHDDRGNPVVRYPGPLHFSSSDAQADLPPDAPLTNGSGVFSVTFKTHGPQTITAADAAVNTIAATSDPVPVSAGPAARFLVEVVDPAAARREVLLSIQPVDSVGNPAEYDGAVRVTSTPIRSPPCQPVPGSAAADAWPSPSGRPESRPSRSHPQ